MDVSTVFLLLGLTLIQLTRADTTCGQVCSTIIDADFEDCIVVCEHLQLQGFLCAPDASSQEESVENPEPQTNKRAGHSAFVRIGRDPFERQSRPASSFVRIGRGEHFMRVSRSPSEGADQQAQMDELFASYPEKRKSSFVRIGKSDDPNAKRVSSFVRIGKDYPESQKRVSSFVRIGKALNSSPYGLKRVSSFVRIGKSGNDGAKRVSSFVRIGKAVDDAESYVKRHGKSAFVRIGKSHGSDSLKRLSNFVRIGKKSFQDMSSEKRKSAFVRIGKKPSSFVRIGKKASSFVRIGKKPSSFVRIGKKPSSFVRIGKASSFVRIGKDVNDMDALREQENKKASSFVRIGKRTVSDSSSEESQES